MSDSAIMYAGTTFRTKSGRIIGVHQKIDRVARRHLKKMLPSSVKFPSAQAILHFEGRNGPDGIKRKSPGRDEPWHFIDPLNPNDRQLVKMIEDHVYNLAQALKADNQERAAFEAAWMAHAVVDGLTPAHHYPLEEKLAELRGEGMETRNSTKEKLIMPGLTRRKQLQNNWEFWGAKGVMTTHLSFELGVATTIAPLHYKDIEVHEDDVKLLHKIGFSKYFLEALQRVSGMEMYKEFSRTGWNRHMVRETRSVLIPEIVTTVLLGWYEAVRMAEGKK